MLCRAWYCYGKLCVCLSVYDISRNSLKVISWLINLGYSLSADPNIADLLQREKLQNFGQNKGEVWKKVTFCVQKL